MRWPFGWGKGRSQSLGGVALPGPRLPAIPSPREPRWIDRLYLKRVHPSLDLYWEPDWQPIGAWRIMAHRESTERVQAGRSKLLKYAEWPEGATRAMWRQAAMMAEGWGVLHTVERWEVGLEDVREVARLFYIAEAELRRIYAEAAVATETAFQARLAARQAVLRDYQATEGRDRWHRTMRGRKHYASAAP